MAKSTPGEIRARFDQDVERFSNVETGQTAAMDSRLMLDLIAQTAAALAPRASALLDIGCGAGNYSLVLAGVLPLRSITLIDLSGPMLIRAVERLSAGRELKLHAIQRDIREADPGEERFDVAVAAAALHHLREEPEWRAVFGSVFRALRPGGAFFIADMVNHDDERVHGVQWNRYGAYLTALREEAYRDHVFAYIEKEDTPRSVGFQMRLLGEAGFSAVDILHKNGPFACLSAVKGTRRD
jgi:tRNA (cmo5U34)-methyltransferase